MGIIDRYLADFSRKAKTTKSERRYVLGEFEEFLKKRKRSMEDFAQKDVEAWLRHLTARQIKASSRNVYLGMVKHFAKWMHDELPIPVERDELREVLQRQRELRHIVGRVERFEASEPSERAIPPEIMRKLLRASERRPNHHRAFVLYGYFGLRRDEGRLLTTKDVDFRRNEIRIRRETTKTPSGVRTIPFHPAIAEHLRSDGGYVLGGEEPYSKEFFFTFLRGYDKVAGFHLRVKQFRSAFDTFMSENLERAFKSHIRAKYITKKLMGHKTKGADLTEYYIGHTEREEEDKRDAMTKHHWMVREGLI